MFVMLKGSLSEGWNRNNHDDWPPSAGRKPKPARCSPVTFLTVYFALVASSSPSLSQLIIGLGFPWAEQLSTVLPPSFASTYCGGVAVNEGGAVERVRVGVIHVKVNILKAVFKKCTEQGRNPQLWRSLHPSTVTGAQTKT